MARDGLLNGLKRLYHSLPRPPSTNYQPNPFLFNPYGGLSDGAVILDIGGKNARGSYAFGVPPNGCRLIALDIEPGPGVDLVADAHNLDMLEDESVDCVVAVSALEHMAAPWRVVEEIYRVLKPGGKLYVNTPFVFPYHGDPEDFYRFSQNGLKQLCGEFDLLQSGFNRGPASTMTHLLVHSLALTLSFNRKLYYGVLVDLFTWLLFWIKYLDRFIVGFSMAHIIHSGAYFYGEKPRSRTIST